MRRFARSVSSPAPGNPHRRWCPAVDGIRLVAESGWGPLRGPEFGHGAKRGFNPSRYGRWLWSASTYRGIRRTALTSFRPRFRHGAGRVQWYERESCLTITGAWRLLHQGFEDPNIPEADCAESTETLRRTQDEIGNYCRYSLTYPTITDRYGHVGGSNHHCSPGTRSCSNSPNSVSTWSIRSTTIAPWLSCR